MILTSYAWNIILPKQPTLKDVFKIQAKVDGSKTGQVQISEPHCKCILILTDKNSLI